MTRSLGWRPCEGSQGGVCETCVHDVVIDGLVNGAEGGRELEVAELVAAGTSTREIAATINIETAPVETHAHHLIAKLSLRS